MVFNLRLQSQIIKKLPSSSLPWKVYPASGGSINEAYQFTNGKTSYFCKVNSATKFPHLFQKEKNGLEWIRKHTYLKVPEVLDFFVLEETQILLMEWIEPARETLLFWKKFGEGLAQMHKVKENYFGFVEYNYMGAVPQQNTPTPDWVSFMTGQRLEPLVKKAKEARLLDPVHLTGFDALYKKLPQFFDEAPPSLLHGDLWKGNLLCTEPDLPVVIDPAVYFGHRAMDLGMTTLFGGFPPLFYEAYHYHFPLPKEHPAQWRICQIYPLLIHLIIFGKSYLPKLNERLKEFA